MKPARSFPCGARASRGFSLIELMIALVLGLLVVGAAIGIFLSNRQVFRATDNLSFVQENGRVAFELLARELRQTAGSPCSASAPVVNVLNNTTAWGTDWGDGIRGYDGQAGQALPSVTTGTAARQRIAGTDAVELRSGASGDVTVVDHTPNSAQFKVNTNAHGLADGDIVMVCDFIQAAIFQVTNANSSNVTIVHNTGTGTPALHQVFEVSAAGPVRGESFRVLLHIWPELGDRQAQGDGLVRWREQQRPVASVPVPGDADQ